MEEIFPRYHMHYDVLLKFSTTLWRVIRRERVSDYIDSNVDIYYFFFMLFMLKQTLHKCLFFSIALTVT